jgi:hypothetical protein
MTQTPETLDSIPVAIDHKELQRKLHMKPGALWERVLSLAESAQPFIEPKVIFKASFIDEKLPDGVIIDGIRLTSTVLRKQLEKVERVFPYVMTIGPAWEKMAEGSDDYLEQYYLDNIANVALISSRRFFTKHLKTRFALENLSRLGPGSLENWPISEQAHLFAILGDVETEIGVSLTESFLMMPRKSSSGIYFATEIPFYACQLCPRDKCPSRKAAYDPNEAEEYALTKPNA